MRRIYKEVETENGTKIKIYGSNKWIKIRHAKPDWSKDEYQGYVMYRKRRFYLDNFLRIGYGGGYVPKWMKEFDGQADSTFFSCYLIKLSEDGEAAKVFFAM